MVSQQFNGVVNKDVGHGMLLENYCHIVNMEFSLVCAILIVENSIGYRRIES